MKLSQSGVNLIKSFEGLLLNASDKLDGIPTIGYGHTQGVRMGDKITELQADKLLKEDVARFERGVMRILHDFNIEVNQNQFDALVSFAFNVGLGNLKKSTLLKKLYLMNKNDPASVEAVANEFVRWNKCGGKVLAGLTKRRQRERELFLTKPQ